MPSAHCFGEVLWDVFPHGRKLGGAPLNVAYHLARLGVESSIVSAVGQDSLGEEAFRRVAEAGVDTRHLASLGGQSTGEARVTLDSAGHAKFELLRDVAWDAIPAPQKPGRVDVLVFGTLALRSAANRGVLSDLLAQKVSEWVVCDLNLRPPFDALEPLAPLLGQAHLLKVNDSEASQLVGLANPSDQARLLQARFGVRTVCITLGAAGALLRDGEQCFRSPAPPITVVDTVGAGDAFTAGLLAGLCRNPAKPDWARALRLGTALGSYVAASEGAQPSHAGFVAPPWEAPTG